MEKIYLLLICTLLVGFQSYAQPTNYTVNGDFEEDYVNWMSGAGNGAAVDFQMESEDPISGSRSAKLTITGKGTNTFDPFLDTKITLHKGVPMKLTFKAKASATTFVNLEVAQNYPPFLAPLKTMEIVVINTEVQDFEYIFTPESSDGKQLKF